MRRHRKEADLTLHIWNKDSPTQAKQTPCVFSYFNPKAVNAIPTLKQLPMTNWPFFPLLSTCLVQGKSGWYVQDCVPLLAPKVPQAAKPIQGLISAITHPASVTQSHPCLHASTRSHQVWGLLFLLICFFKFLAPLNWVDQLVSYSRSDRGPSSADASVWAAEAELGLWFLHSGNSSVRLEHARWHFSVFLYCGFIISVQH